MCKCILHRTPMRCKSIVGHAHGVLAVPMLYLCCTYAVPKLYLCCTYAVPMLYLQVCALANVVWV